MKKLSKTEKIKRLRLIKSGLKNGDCWYMCHFYDRKFHDISSGYVDKLFKEIPELWRFRPKHKLLENGDAWWFEGETKQRLQKIIAIDKAIKLIQSK